MHVQGIYQVELQVQAQVTMQAQSVYQAQAQVQVQGIYQGQGIGQVSVVFEQGPGSEQSVREEQSIRKVVPTTLRPATGGNEAFDSDCPAGPPLNHARRLPSSTQSTRTAFNPTDLDQQRSDGRTDGETVASGRGAATQISASEAPTR